LSENKTNFSVENVQDILNFSSMQRKRIDVHSTYSSVTNNSVI